VLARLASVCVCLVSLLVVAGGATAKPLARDVAHAVRAAADTAPDLQVTGTASNTAPVAGDVVQFALSVYDANAQPAQSLNLTLTLPSGLQFVSGTSDRGSGCKTSGTTQVVCFLDWLSKDARRANVQVSAKVITPGQLVLSATATSQQGVLTPANSTLSLTLLSPTSTVAGVPTGLNGNGPTTIVSDVKAPTTRALVSAGKRGTTAKLRFQIYDDSGVARALTTVKRDGKTIGSPSTGYGPVVNGTVYFVGWHIPSRAAKGRYTFCVVAVDRARHHSGTSCAALTVK